MIVMMPDKGTYKSHQLYLLAVEFSNNFWTPAFFELGEFFFQVYFFHVIKIKKRSRRAESPVTQGMI